MTGRKVKTAPLPKPSASALLRWYDRQRRDLPWRALPGQVAQPYHVWLSEIMLQQTTVAAVIPYYRNFLSRWPTIAALAAAPLDDVLTAWAGLGYYRRAHNLRRCAQVVVAQHGGVLPATEPALLGLPGIGAYTAAAIAAIAFNQRANVVDGNVERVIARIYCVDQPLNKAKSEIKALAAGLLPKKRHGDYAQALMDLGATICTPRQPACETCPWRKTCKAYQQDKVTAYPVAAARQLKPVRRAIAFWLENDRGEVWLRRRADTGLLAGMIEIPSSPWLEQEMPTLPMVEAFAPRQGRWRKIPYIVSHIFTHFELHIQIVYGYGEPATKVGFWAAQEELKNLALPSVMHKIVVAVNHRS